MSTISEADQRSINLPVVSAIIPCHNHENYVARAIESVVAQDYPAKVLAIIDDGSEDNSYYVIKNLLEEQEDLDSLRGKYAIKGKINGVHSFLLKNEEPTGPSAARNLGIKMLWNTTHFFAPLDADDYYLPKKLSKSVMEILKDPLRIGLVYSDVIIHNEEKNTDLYEYRRPFNRQVLEQDNIISNAPLINKVALQDVGLYDENLRTCEDYDLWLRITETFVAIHIPEALQVYSVTGVNATNIVNQEQWMKDRQTVYYKMLERKRG